MPVFESSRKVQVFGSSLALTLPAMFVKVNEIEKGSIMKVLYGLDGVLVASQVEDDGALRECLLNILDNLERLMKRRIEEGEGDASRARDLSEDPEEGRSGRGGHHKHSGSP